MKTVATVLLALFVASSSAHAQGVAWQELSFDDALAAAQAQDTLLFVDVYATWCGPCLRLDAEVFPTSQAGAATDGLVALRIDAESGEGPAIAERYHVVGFPTLLLLDAQGQEIDRVFGFLPPDEFAETVRGYREGRGTIEELRARVAADPSDLALVLELGERAAVRGEGAEALALLERVIAEDADNAAGLRVRAHHTLGKYLYLRGSGDLEAAKAQLRIVLEQFPDTPQAEDAAYQMLIAEIRGGETEAAQARIAGLLGAEPDADAINAICWLCYRERFQMAEAVAMARAALEREPGAASLWDTLAELQFAQGDAASAVASTQRAIEAAPDETYYQRQLARFSSGL